MLMFSLCWAAALLHALLTWRAGGISLGQVISFMGLMGTFRFPTFISIFSFNLVQMGIAGARRILEVINVETELDENEQGVTQPIQGAVTFEHVSFSYRGTAMLKDLSFSVQPGETIAIVGQTGSGKSTLTRLINRIFDADGGRVLVTGWTCASGTWNRFARRWRLSSKTSFSFRAPLRKISPLAAPMRRKQKSSAWRARRRRTSLSPALKTAMRLKSASAA